MDILKNISAKSNNDEEILDIVENLTSDFDERITLEHENGDNKEDYKTKYENMKQRYVDRFFSAKSEEIKEDVKEDAEKDDNAENITYDQLFKEREG